MNEIAFYHGAVLFNLLKCSLYESVHEYKGNHCSYVVNNKSGLYIKHSTKEMAPWSFTFTENHVQELCTMHNELDRLFVIVICGEDGICCLDWDEFRGILSTEGGQFPKWVTVARKRGEKYTVKGSDGQLKHKIGLSDFPRKIYEA